MQANGTRNEDANLLTCISNSLHVRPYPEGTEALLAIDWLGQNKMILPPKRSGLRAGC